MKVLIVFAHPEPKSLSTSLKNVAINEIKSQGHEVKVTDLYAENWNPLINRSDFLNLQPDKAMRICDESGEAYAAGMLTEDVKQEQEKLKWADVLILQFPFWWFSMPAILKGWIDRVYSSGLAYGVGEYNDERSGDQYGEGSFAGKKAMLIVTVGGPEKHYKNRGISGDIDDLLFPINHGLLFYPGYSVLPPFIVYDAQTAGEKDYEAAAEKLRERIRSIDTDSPIPYRTQNGGDYVFPYVTCEMILSPILRPFLFIRKGQHRIEKSHVRHEGPIYQYRWKTVKTARILDCLKFWTSTDL
ncbi:LANO_0F00166g1_1 [Lachancea nothofagi CBS 11611]|uniref:LANO_0F00166g1_1 n=1 Tax=Lachancea nothofagi CBS 11611 TaxID=1266666 RepID=A0A1G4K544_9SACH|nr:LANO_0F00166g1_1 [Lachancea nothofagi CBS 11611]